MRQNSLKLGLCVCFVWTAATGALAQAPQSEPTLRSAIQTVRVKTGAEVEVESGTLIVPESRVTSSARQVTLPFYRLRSTSSTPATPIFLLAGGPGSSWLDQFEEDENFNEVMFYRSIADVVLFDQRGGGRALPALPCSETGSLPTQGPLDLKMLHEIVEQITVACRNRLESEGVDVSAYNTVENAADVDALRAALGYDRVTLIGGSYGSHLGLQVMRLYPRSVERAVFYGVEGPDGTWDDPDAILAGLQRLAEVAEQSSELGPAIPEGGLVAALNTVLADLELRPRIVRVGDGSTSTDVTVTADLVRLIARSGAGRRSNLNAWPELILAMTRGDFSRAAAARVTMSRVTSNDASHNSMDCSSGISAARRARYDASPATQTLGHLNMEYEMICDSWPARVVDEAYRQTVQSSAPTLLIQGTWDLSTPIENAREALTGLSNGQLIEVNGGGHGALYNLYENWPPMKEQLGYFLRGEAVEFPAIIDMPPPVFKPESGR